MGGIIDALGEVIGSFMEDAFDSENVEEEITFGTEEPVKEPIPIQDPGPVVNDCCCCCCHC